MRKEIYPCDGCCLESTHPSAQRTPSQCWHCHVTIRGISRQLRNGGKGQTRGWVCLSALQKDSLRMTEGRWSSETPCAMPCILPPTQHAPSHFATKENESQVKWLATGHTVDARCCRRAVLHSYNRIFLRAAAVNKRYLPSA